MGNLIDCNVLFVADNVAQGRGNENRRFVLAALQKLHGFFFSLLVLA
jgi:hypothetical protein